jgi:hypothetical protein
MSIDTSYSIRLETPLSEMTFSSTNCVSGQARVEAELALKSYILTMLRTISVGTWPTVHRKAVLIQALSDDIAQGYHHSMFITELMDRLSNEIGWADEMPHGRMPWFKATPYYPEPPLFSTSTP